MKVLVLFLLTITLVFGQAEFEAVRKKPLWLDQTGVVRIDDSGISFAANGEDAARTWKYEDIQHLDRISPTEFTLLSYEDVAWKLGRDRTYRFELTTQEFSDQLFETVAARIGKPATDRVTERPAVVEQQILAKHLKTFGGSEGTLYFSPERIVYSTDAQEQAREWLLDRDIQSVWSSDPYRLEIHVYEANPRAFRKPQVYKFALKQPLNPEVYRRFKLALYELARPDGGDR
jgi:hypothetical protein